MKITVIQKDKGKKEIDITEKLKEIKSSKDLEWPEAIKWAVLQIFNMIYQNFLS